MDQIICWDKCMCQNHEECAEAIRIDTSEDPCYHIKLHFHLSSQLQMYNFIQSQVYAQTHPMQTWPKRCGVFWWSRWWSRHWNEGD